MQHNVISSSATQPRVWVWASWGIVLIGAGWIVHFIVGVGTGVVFEACVRIGLWLIPILVAPLIGHFLHTMAWRFALPPDIRPKPLTALRVVVGAQAANAIGFGVLGEPLKVAALPSKDRERALAGMLVDNVTLFSAMPAFLMVTGITWASSSATALTEQQWVIAGLFATIVAALLFLILVRPPKKSLPRWIRNTLGPARTKHIEERVAHTVIALREPLVERPRDVFAAIALHSIGKLWLLAELTVVTRALGCASVGTVAALGLSSVIAGVVGAPVPGQIGVVDGALIAAGRAMGLDEGTALVLALVRRARGYAWIGFGALLVRKG